MLTPSTAWAVCIRSIPQPPPSGYVVLQLESPAIALRFVSAQRNGAGSTSTTPRCVGPLSAKPCPRAAWSDLQDGTPTAAWLGPSNKKNGSPRRR